MTADGTDDKLVNLEGHGGPYTLIDADDGEELRDDVASFAPADDENPAGSSDEDDDGETKGDDDGRVRRSDDGALWGSILDDDDDLGAVTAILHLECPPGYVFSPLSSSGP